MKKTTHIMIHHSAVSYDKDSDQFEQLFSLPQTNNIINNRINDFVLDPSDNNLLWCATGDIWGRGSYGGLIHYNMETGETKLFSHKNTIFSPKTHIRLFFTNYLQK